MVAPRPKIELRRVTKIFGPNPKAALALIRAGMTKEELLTKTGHDLALCDVSLSVAESEVFAVMGLSGSGKSTLIRHIQLCEPCKSLKYRWRPTGSNIMQSAP